MSQDFAVSRLDGSDVIDQHEAEHSASALVRTDQNGPSSVTGPVPQIWINQPSNMITQSSNPVNQSSNLFNQASNLPNQSSNPVNQSSNPVNQSSNPVNQSSNLFNQASNLPKQSSNPVNQSSNPVNQPSNLPNQSSNPVNQSSNLNQPSNPVNQPSDSGPKAGLRQDDDDNIMASEMNEEQRVSMLEAVAAAQDPQTFMTRFQSAIPDGFGISLKDLRVIIAPDKWVRDQEKEKMAVEATQNLEYAMNILGNELGEIERKGWKYFHEDPPVAEVKREQTGLRKYHIESHMKATKHLEFLYKSMLKGDWTKDQTVKTHREALAKINMHLNQLNKANGYRSDLGCVEHFRLLGNWKAIESSRGNKEAENSAEATTAAFCRELQYPDGWSSCPPRKSYRYEPVHGYQSLLWSSLTPYFHSWWDKSLTGSADAMNHFRKVSIDFAQELQYINSAYNQDPTANYVDVWDMAGRYSKLAHCYRTGDFDDFDEEYSSFMQLCRMRNYPDDWQCHLLPGSSQIQTGQAPMGSSQVPMGQPPMGSSQAPMGQSPMGSSQVPVGSFKPPMSNMGDNAQGSTGSLQASSSNSQAVQVSNQMQGRRMVVALKPHTSKRSIEPGKTSRGEKIKYIQQLGPSRANFVVESTDGSVRLATSASAGGKLAIEGAVSQGVPYTTQKPEEISELKRRVRSGGMYGLTFVALGEWDISRNRLPFTVVGFYHTSPTEHVEVAISRSSLAKVISPSEAERLIGEGVSGAPDITLRDALESRFLGISPLFFPQRANNRHLSLENQPQSVPWGAQNTFAAAGPGLNTIASQPILTQPQASLWDGTWGHTKPGGQMYGPPQLSYAQTSMMPQWNHPQEQQSMFQNSYFKQPYFGQPYFQQPSTFQSHSYGSQPPMLQQPTQQPLQGYNQPAMTQAQTMPSPSVHTDSDEL